LAKEYEALKSKKDFSLDSTLEEEVLVPIKQKDELLENKAKQLQEFQAENSRLSKNPDLLDRGTVRLTEMKEDKDRTVRELVSQKRSLETEVSALNWKIEELENTSMASNESLALVPNVASGHDESRCWFYQWLQSISWKCRWKLHWRILRQRNIIPISHTGKQSPWSEKLSHGSRVKRSPGGNLIV